MLLHALYLSYLNRSKEVGKTIHSFEEWKGSVMKEFKNSGTCC